MSHSKWNRPQPRRPLRIISRISRHRSRTEDRVLDRRLHLEQLEPRRLLATFEVTSTLDVVDQHDGVLTLREAIEAANTDEGLDLITFNIPAADTGAYDDIHPLDGHVYYQDDGVANQISLNSVASTIMLDDADLTGIIDPDWSHSWYSIQPESPLPPIKYPVFIDGFTQPGAQANTQPLPPAGEELNGYVVSDGILRIELNGTFAGNANGLTITAGNCTVRGLVINGFEREGIYVTGGGVSIPSTPPEGVISWWPGGGNGEDIVGGNHGTIEAGVAVGAAFDFDGSGGVNLGDVPAFDFTQSSSFTMEAWINRTGTGGIVNLNYNCNSGGIYTAQMLAISANEKLFFQVRDASGVSSGPVWGPELSTDVWHHVAAVRDAGGPETMLRLYVDGVEVASAVDITTGPLARDGSDLIGRRNWCGDTSPFKGSIDELRIFDRALSASEIQAAFNAGTVSQFGGSLNLIQGNYIGTDVSGRQGLNFHNGGRGIYLAPGANQNVIGTDGDGVADEGERNVISGHDNGSGVQIGSDYNVVAGNFIGTDVTGSKALGNYHGLVIDGDDNLIGTNADGLADEAERNIISGNFTPNYPYGSDIDLANGVRNVIAGNFIGTDVTGTEPMDQRSFIGILVLNGTSSYNRIGTDGDGLDDGVDDAVERNIISGHAYGGIGFGFGTYEHNLIAGNYIGTDFSGAAALGNEFYGVGILAVTGSNQIGGIGTLGNTIAFNKGPGIWMVADDVNPSAGNKIQGNSIHSNDYGDPIVSLGIDLGGTWSGGDVFAPSWDGPTSNNQDEDPYDVDSGPNNLQNYPVITLAQAGTTTRVAGSLQSLQSTTENPDPKFTLDFYANSVADPSGYGEGERYLGWATVTTDESGHTDFDVVLSGATTPGEFITATATERVEEQHYYTGQPTGSTSEFSLAAAAGQSQTGGLQGIIDTLHGTLLTLNHIDESNLTSLTEEIAALDPRPTDPVIKIEVNLQPGTYDDELVVTVPAGFEVELNGYNGPVTFVGSSPALTLISGELHIVGGSSVEVHVAGGVTFTNTTDSPSILVEGGNLVLRKCVVEETTGGDRAAIEVIGGTVDLGSTTDPGANTIIVNGAGDFIRTFGPGTVSNVGNTSDVAPDFDAGSDETLVLSEGGTFSREIVFVDPDPDVWSGTVNFGDGSPDEPLVIDQIGKSFTLSHKYTEEGTFPVTVTLEDNHGGRHSDSFQVAMILNQSPLIQDQSFEVDENLTAVGALIATDPDLPGDTLTYSISGGPDRGLFTIDAVNGALSFLAAPDFEIPGDANQDNLYELEVTVTDDYEACDTSRVIVNVLNLASITGDVFVDVNENGLREANEPGIDGVIVELLDELGNAVLDLDDPVTAITGNGGFYLFEDLDGGTYQLHEIQPTGVDDGAELIGSLGGSLPADDTMQLNVHRTDAADYAFSEFGQQVSSGDTASIGFWQNKHGRALIEQGGAALADWLTSNFSNVFGTVFTGDNATGARVAEYYRNELFRQKAQKGAGPAKLDCQFMATALATFFTKRSLAGEIAVEYGFRVTDTGIATRIVNIGDCGQAFDASNGTSLTIMDLLIATNAATDVPDNLTGSAYIYDLNGDGTIDAYEAFLRTMANDVYSSINEGGGS